MTATLTRVSSTPAVEVSGSVLRAFAALVPTRSEYKTVPPVCILDPLPDGRVRLFAANGVAAVILKGEGHCQRRLAVEMPILRRLLTAHRDAELVAITAGEDEPFLRLRSFSQGQTVAIEAAAAAFIVEDQPEPVQGRFVHRF